MTPIEARNELAKLNTPLEETKARLDLAKDSLDGALLVDAQTAMSKIIDDAGTLIAIISPARPTRITEKRCEIVVKAAATLSPGKMKDIIDAVRVSSGDSITLPPGKFEHCSRGKGWCRQGSGPSATWGEKVEGGYRVAATGKWIVGSDDGFSRKDKREWAVKKVGDFWIAN